MKQETIWIGGETAVIPSIATPPRTSIPPSGAPCPKRRKQLAAPLARQNRRHVPMTPRANKVAEVPRIMLENFPFQLTKAYRPPSPMPADLLSCPSQMLLEHLLPHGRARRRVSFPRADAGHKVWAEERKSILTNNDRYCIRTTNGRTIYGCCHSVA